MASLARRTTRQDRTLSRPGNFWQVWLSASHLRSPAAWKSPEVHGITQTGKYCRPGTDPTFQASRTCPGCRNLVTEEIDGNRRRQGVLARRDHTG